MILFSYEKVISIKVLHGFYRDKLSPDLSFSPTERTSALMTNYGLKFYRGKHGFDLLGETSGDGILKKPLPSSLVLTFLAELHNPYFINFSSLPLDAGKKIYRFSNGSLNQQEPPGISGQKLMLHDGGSVGSGSLSPVSGDNYSFFLPATATQKTGEIVDDLTDTAVMKEKGTVSGGGNEFSFILNGLDEGVYRMEVDGSEHDRFYYLPGFTSRKAFAVLDIFVNTPGTNKFVNSAGRIFYREYCLYFAPRKTFWHYIISNRNELSMPDPVVEQASLPLMFNTNSVTSYTSSAPLELSETPVKNIRLLGDSGDPDSVLIDNLPNAGFEVIRPDPDDSSKVYSDIYIYI